MDARKTLLDKLEALDALDEDHLPVVTLDEYFDGNAQEDSIAPNQWGYGRPTLREIHAHFQAIARRPDVQGVYVGLHQDWGMALECDDWPAAENIHVISSATQADAERWLEGLEADGLITGWPYGKHAAGPEAGRGSRSIRCAGTDSSCARPGRHACLATRPGRVPACPLNSGPGIQDRPRQWRDVFPGQQPQPDQQGVGMSGRDAERLAADGVHARPSQARHQILRAPPRPAGSHKPQPAVDGDPNAFSSVRATACHNARACSACRAWIATTVPSSSQCRASSMSSGAQASPHDMARLSRTRRFGSGATR